MTGSSKKTRAKALNHITSRREEFFENQLKWLTAEEAAVYLRLPSVDMIRYLVYEKRITFYKLGRSLRFKPEDLDAMLESTQSIGRIL